MTIMQFDIDDGLCALQNAVLDSNSALKNITRKTYRQFGDIDPKIELAERVFKIRELLSQIDCEIEGLANLNNGA